MFVTNITTETFLYLRPNNITFMTSYICAFDIPSSINLNYCRSIKVNGDGNVTHCSQLNFNRWVYFQFQVTLQSQEGGSARGNWGMPLQYILKFRFASGAISANYFFNPRPKIVCAERWIFIRFHSFADQKTNARTNVCFDFG